MYISVFVKAFSGINMVRINEKLLKQITVLAKDGYDTIDGTNARFINAADPVNEQDLATKHYVNNSISTGSVRSSTTSTDNALAVWDGVDGYIIKNSTVIFDGNSLSPDITLTLDLGSSDKYWNDGYISNLHCSNVILGEGSVGVSEIELGGANQVLWSDGSNNNWTGAPIVTSLTLNGTLSGVTTIESDYLTTTPNDVTFNFGSEDVVIGDGYINTKNVNAVDGYFSNSVTIDGKLTVGGLIDPTGLVIDNQATVPGGAPASGKTTIWTRSSDGYIIATNEYGQDLQLNGIVPGSENSERILQSNISGTGVDYAIIESSLSSDIGDDGIRHLKRDDLVVITDYPYSASRSIVSTTGSINSSSVNLTVADGSTFLYNHGLVIQGAGADHGLATPAAPEVYQQGTTGSSTVEVKVVAATRHRGYTAASALTQITNAAATFTITDWLGVWPEIVPGATWYLIYLRRGSAGSFTLKSVIPAQLNPSNGYQVNRPVAVINSEDPIFIPAMFPSTAPAASQNNYLRARVISGSGTNSLVLDRAASASVSNVNVYHDDWEAIRDAIDSFPTLISLSNGGHIYLPRGQYVIFDDIRINRNITFEGAGGGMGYARTFIAPTDSLNGITIEGSHTAPQWVPGVPVRVGERIRPQKYWQNSDYTWVCTTAGTTGTTYPTFVYSAGETITDGTVIWECNSSLLSTGQQSLLTNFCFQPQTNIGPSLGVGALKVIRQSGIGTSPNAILWTPGMSLVNNYWIVPPDGYETGFRYKISGSGTSGSEPPDFGKVNGGTTVDNGVDLIAEWTPIVWGAGILIHERCVVKNVGVWGIGGTAFYLNGKPYSERSNCNGFSIQDFNVAWCGGGTYAEGSDAQAGVFANGTVTLCGFGTIDISFYGNKYSNILYEANYTGPQNSAYSNYQHMLFFDKCYWEDMTAGNGCDPDHYLYMPAYGNGGIIGSGALIKGNMLWDPYPNSVGCGTKIFTTARDGVSGSIALTLAWTQYFPIWMYTSSENGENRGDLRFKWFQTERKWVVGMKEDSAYRVIYELLQNYGKLDAVRFHRPIIFSQGYYGSKLTLGMYQYVPVAGVWNKNDTLLWAHSANIARTAIKNITTGCAYPEGSDGYTVWAPSTTYLLNQTPSAGSDITICVSNTAKTKLFALIKQGISGNTEPVWNTTAEAYTLDGTCWWQYWGDLDQAEWTAIPNDGVLFTNLGNSNYNINYGYRRLHINTNYTTDRTLTLLNTDVTHGKAIKGDRLDILRDEGSQYVAHINNWDGSLITDLRSPGSVELIFDGTDWTLLNNPDTVNYIDGYFENVISDSLKIDNTITGTIGDVTINKTAGRCILAASASTVTVTNSYVTADSIIILTISSDDATAKSVIVTPTTGSFAIKANAAATANTNINFLIIN